jgi:hypothetical protein
LHGIRAAPARSAPRSNHACAREVCSAGPERVRCPGRCRPMVSLWVHSRVHPDPLRRRSPLAAGRHNADHPGL